MAVFKCDSYDCKTPASETEDGEERGYLFVIPGLHGTDFRYVENCPFCGKESPEVVTRSANDKSNYDPRLADDS